MDASQYKDYVLVLLFVKYVSDKYAGQKGRTRHCPILGHVLGRYVIVKDLKGSINQAIMDL
jgi:hypothetical protein